MSDWPKLFIVSAVVMGMAQTIAKERMFAPLRERLGGKRTWVGYLVSCPFCLSHWLAFALVPLTGAYFVKLQPDWGFFGHVLDWFFSSILVAVIAAYMRVVFWLVDESQGLVKREQKLLDEEVRQAHQHYDHPEGRNREHEEEPLKH